MKMWRETLFCTIWAVATVAAALWLDSGAGGVLLAVGSGLFLTLFMLTWDAAGFSAAAVSYAVPAGMLLAGSLILAYVNKVAGGALLILAGPVWIWMTYRAFMRSRKPIFGSLVAKSDTEFLWEDNKHEATLPLLPGVSVSAPNWDGEFSGINSPGRREAVSPWSQYTTGHQD